MSSLMHGIEVRSHEHREIREAPLLSDLFDAVRDSHIYCILELKVGARGLIMWQEPVKQRADCPWRPGERLG